MFLLQDLTYFQNLSMLMTRCFCASDLRDSCLVCGLLDELDNDIFECLLLTWKVLLLAICYSAMH